MLPIRKDSSLPKASKWMTDKVTYDTQTSSTPQQQSLQLLPIKLPNTFLLEYKMQRQKLIQHSPGPIMFPS